MAQGKPEHDSADAWWDYICKRLHAMGCVSEHVLHSPCGRLLPDFTPREADEADLLDALRAFGEARAREGVKT